MTKRSTLALTLPFFGGVAALSWEVIWQLKTSLAFGVSALGAAITLATMMAGMTIGAVVCGRKMERQPMANPLRFYGLLELAIGGCGIALGACFNLLEQMDQWVYQLDPAFAPLAQLMGVVFVIFIPAACMGASVPVFGGIGRRFDVPVSVLYGANTIGAALGTLGVAFVLIPQFGIQGTAYCAAAINVLVGLVAVAAARPETAVVEEARKKLAIAGDLPSAAALATVFVTGCVTFMLEVAWFRALRAAFETTTTGFAVMLSVVLLALGAAARAVPYLKRRGVHLQHCLMIAGVSILIGTPVIERLDLMLVHLGSHNTPLLWFALTSLLVGPAVFFLGVPLPWHLESNYSPRGLGRIYGVNTVGAIVGAISAAWWFLPSFGFVQTAWFAGGSVVAFTALVYRRELPAWSPAVGLAAVLLAIALDSGVGEDRVLLTFAYGDHEVIEHVEGPDAGTSAIEFENGSRGVFIDGFAAAAFWPTACYMDWMGSLPVLLHEDPKEALVICFGTGQTANAVRNEGVTQTTIVDINPAVFHIARHFPDNDQVLQDPTVTKVVMDGRAFLRRTQRQFDIITLEPMPPNHAGVNALYSREFYELARQRLGQRGVVAQWLPAHLVSEPHARAIAKTFQDVFPNAALWIDPSDRNGILLGTNDLSEPLGSTWPGLQRTGPHRALPPEAIRAALELGPKELARYAGEAPVVTDDNQLLAYGKRHSIKESGTRDTELVYHEFVEAVAPDDRPHAITRVRFKE